MKLAIAKRRSKRLAAGTLSFADAIGVWYLMLYGVTNGIVHPFGASPFDSDHAALQEGNDVLKVSDTDWIELPESEVDGYILANTRNSWNPKTGLD